jgi:hypothetical protein
MCSKQDLDADLEVIFLQKWEGCADDQISTKVYKKK